MSIFILQLFSFCDNFVDKTFDSLGKQVGTYQKGMIKVLPMNAGRSADADRPGQFSAVLPQKILPGGVKELKNVFG